MVTKPLIPAETKPLIPAETIANMVNSLRDQQLGLKTIVNEDLSNLVDFGKEYESLDSGNKKIVTSKMITLVSKQLTISKAYKGNGIDLIRSRGPYDAASGIIQKNRVPLPKALDDSEVYDPEPGSSSDPFVNHPLAFETEYFYKLSQFLYEWSKPDRWMSGMFLSAENFYTAIAAVDQAIKNALTLNIEDLSMSALRASIASNLSTVVDLSTTGSNQAVNLLAKFKAATGSTVTAANAMGDAEFLRYAIHEIFVTTDYMRSYSTMYNERNYPQFTPEDETSMVMLSKFRRAVDQYLLSDTYHDEYLKIPNHSSITAWQGFLLDSDTPPDFKSTSTVKVTGASNWKINPNDEPLTVDTDGVLATVFSNERLGIYNLGIENTSMRDPKGLKTNYFTHVACQALVDPYENAVTFYIKD